MKPPMPCLSCCWRRSEDVSPEGIEATAQTSAGNPRNKCALQPGHSLMDWIRLGSSGKDLTHVGPMAGKLNVATRELAKHRTENDAWLAIRGKVFNVTDYLPFHPGGIDQMLQGCGKDATDLFDNIHPWVNFEKILMKCYIGVLSANITDEIIVTTEASTSQQPPKKTLENVIAGLHGLAGNSANVPGSQQIEQKTSLVSTPTTNSQRLTVNFDWIQKAETLFLYFYTGVGSNPFVEILPPVGKVLTITIIAQRTSHVYVIDFLHQILWPVTFKMNYETGKLEVIILKEKKAVWTTFGTIATTVAEVHNTVQKQHEGLVTFAKRINYNCFFYEITRKDRAVSNVPLGKHVKIFNNEGQWRSYSPIPCGLRENFAQEKFTTAKICLLVKRYEHGLLSTYITNKKLNDEILISDPAGSFDFAKVTNMSHFIVLVAGTGLNPLLSLILALLDRKMRPVKNVQLLFFNRNEVDLFFKNDLINLSERDPRFHIDFILSQGSAYWSGLRGIVREELIRNTMNRTGLAEEEERHSLYMLACGSTGFTDAVHEILEKMLFNLTNLYIFPG